MARKQNEGDTREKLIRAAEQLFATLGVDGTQTRDITRLAGQSNPSAIQYHFGSRQALLDTILKDRQARTEATLRVLLDELGRPEQDGPSPLGLAELVGLLVAVEGRELATERGRYGLRIVAQRTHTSGLRTRTPHPLLAGTRVWELIAAIESRLADRSGLAEPLRLERVEQVLTLVGHMLADRAQQYQEQLPPLTDEPLFLADLANVSVALLQAPPPPTRARTPDPVHPNSTRSTT